jgi:hypothetical protein
LAKPSYLFYGQANLLLFSTFWILAKQSALIFGKTKLFVLWPSKALTVFNIWDFGQAKRFDFLQNQTEDSFGNELFVKICTTYARDT